MLMAVIVILYMQLVPLGYIFFPEYTLKITGMTWYIIGFTWISYSIYEILWRWRCQLIARS